MQKNAILPIRTIPGRKKWTHCGKSVSLKSFRFYDRMLPMQDHLSPGGIGNLIALPLQGQALKEENSAFVDENWNAYPDQWKTLLSKQKLPKEFVEDKIKEWKSFLSN